MFESVHELPLLAIYPAFYVMKWSNSTGEVISNQYYWDSEKAIESVAKDILSEDIAAEIRKVYVTKDENGDMLQEVKKWLF